MLCIFFVDMLILLFYYFNFRILLGEVILASIKTFYCDSLAVSSQNLAIKIILRMIFESRFIVKYLKTPETILELSKVIMESELDVNLNYGLIKGWEVALGFK